MLPPPNRLHVCVSVEPRTTEQQGNSSEIYHNHLGVFGVETALLYIHANNVRVQSKWWLQINRYRPSDIIRHLSFLSLSLSVCLNVLFITDSWIGSVLQVNNEINMALSEKSIHTNQYIKQNHWQIKEKGKCWKWDSHAVNYRLLWLQLLILFGFNSSQLPFSTKSVLVPKMGIEFTK